MVPHHRWLAVGVFLVLLSIYLTTYSGRIHSIDEAYIVAVTASLGKGRLDVNQVAFYQPSFSQIAQIGVTGSDGDIFCKKGLAVSLLAFPLFWGLGLLPGVGAVHAAHLTGAAVTALTGSVLYLYLTGLGFSRRTSAVTSLLWGTGTLAWPYARMLFAEPVGALGLAVALYAGALLRRRPETRVAFLAGFGAGSVALAIPSAAPLLPVLAGPLLSPLLNRNCPAPGRLLKGGIGASVPLLVMFAYNVLRFGTPLDTGYRLALTDLRLPLAGTPGLLVTPARGLLFYSPLVLLAIPGYIRGWRRHRTDFAISLSLLGSFLLYYGAWVIWHGGWSWGPRYLVPVLPALSGPIAWTLENFRSLFARLLIFLIVAVSLLVQVIGATANYVQTEFILENDPESRPDEWFYRGQKLLWDPLRSPLVVQARNLGPANLDLGWMVNGRPDGVGFAAATFSLCLGGFGWWFASRRRPMVLPLALCGIGLLSVAWVLVARSTEQSREPFRGDGRLEALSFISAHRMPGDGLISDTGYLYEFILEQYPGLPPAYIPPASDPDMATSLLNLAVARHPRIWFIGGYVMPGDPGRWMEPWLSQNAFPLQSWDFAHHRVSLFSTPGEVLVSGEPGAVLGDVVRLRAFRLTHRREGMDEIFQLAIFWEALSPLQRDYQVFVHAYGPAMDLLAQADHSPVNGFRPTSSWRPGEIVEDRVAFHMPLQSLETGFSLAVGLYDLHSPADRLPVRTPAGTSSDGRVWLVPPERSP